MPEAQAKEAKKIVSHQVENIKETGIIKRNKIEILDLKSICYLKLRKKKIN